VEEKVWRASAGNLNRQHRLRNRGLSRPVRVEGVMEDRHDDDDEPTCHLCGGPLYRAPHWDYYQCDDCGKIEKMEREEP